MPGIPENIVESSSSDMEKPFTQQSSSTERASMAHFETISPMSPMRPKVSLGLKFKETLLSRTLVVGFCIAVALTFVCFLVNWNGEGNHLIAPVDEVNIETEADCQRMCMNNERTIAEGTQEYCKPCEQGALNKCLKFEESEGWRKAQDPRRNGCKYMIEPVSWHPYMVIFCLVIAISMIINEAPAEIVLLAVDVIFLAVGILDKKQAFDGLSNKTVVALAMLFPIAFAIDETGALEVVLSKCLGTPTNLVQAMLRLMAVVAFLSSLLSNTAVVAAMIPAIVAWCRRINISPGLLLMPLSFGAQLGGSCTLIGSSHCVAAKSLTTHIYGDPPMKMFDLTPVGIMLCIVLTGVCILFAGMLPQPPPLERSNEDENFGDYGNHFVVCFVVKLGGTFVGKTVEEIGVERIKGVTSVRKGRVNSETLAEEEEIYVSCSGDGLVSLRQMRGASLINVQEIDLLGTHRRKRRVYEASLRSGCPLLEKEHLTAAHVRNHFGACIISMRRLGEKEPIIWRETGKKALKDGDVILFEAETSFVDSQEWSENFAVVRELKNSAPPRFGSSSDNRRAKAVCFGMLLLISLVAISDIPNLGPVSGLVDLTKGACIFVVILLVTKTITPQQAYQSMKPSVLLVIAGAMGMGTAMEITGVANFVAAKVGVVAGKCGVIGIFVAVYVIAVGLSMFINNSATIAIVAPMLGTLGDPLGIPGKYLTWMLVYSAGSCFTTPLGYQTNMMVMPDGGYSFGDFMKFGAPVQFFHLVSCVLFCWLSMKIGL